MKSKQRFFFPIILFLTLSFSLQSCFTSCPEIYPKAYEEEMEWITFQEDGQDIFMSNDSLFDTLKLSGYKPIGAPRSFHGSPVDIEIKGKCYSYLAINGNLDFRLGDLDIRILFEKDTMNGSRFKLEKPGVVNDSVSVCISIIHGLGPYLTDDIFLFDTLTSKFSDSILFNGKWSENVFHYQYKQKPSDKIHHLCSELYVSRKDGILFIRLSDGRSWTNKKFGE
ncbi:MAG: hypothetical protein M3R17_13085 [Bacteroidota bacterium]|nr:hypothetical protein [Bacteroidota bacterium]